MSPDKEFQAGLGTPQGGIRNLAKQAEAEAHCDYPLGSEAGAQASAARMAAARMLLFRFDDDVADTPAERGHRILFSALEEDEHPDLVGTDELF